MVGYSLSDDRCGFLGLCIKPLVIENEQLGIIGLYIYIYMHIYICTVVHESLD